MTREDGMLEARMRDGLLAYFGRRGMLRGSKTLFGRPAWRAVPSGHEPQALMDASTRQKRLVEYAYATPSTGEDSCAAWVELAFSRFGCGMVGGDAARICRRYCGLTDTADLKAGMAVAVESHPFSVSGREHGHVGIYVGDRTVRECVDEGVRDVPLELWLSYYGAMQDPRWGWLGSIALDL